MNVYAINEAGQLLHEIGYAGRGIIVGKSKDGIKAVTAYFLMGRSTNSRNRIFIENGEDVVINAFDPSKLEDPSLIIYSPIRLVGDSLIVTNGDQTDTIAEFLQKGASFEAALATREFEPDAPNLTPRISAIMNFAEGNFTYKMNILKSADEEGTACNRYTYSYAALPGIGHFIHTYMCDGKPLPTFTGEPKRVRIPDSIDEFKNELWKNLDEENKISLYVRYVDLNTGKIENRMINKNN
ncbi:MAG: IMP cyclohydrolase [Eubacteriales bacterium]|nr:IMP cyclohydrolase [Eubacteriales bacterium]MDD4390506.1 IMP cyclohydrolase [Eubacteriales bacterium]